MTEAIPFGPKPSVFGGRGGGQESFLFNPNATI